MGHWKNRWIQTPQRILMDPCLKQAILDYPLTACLQQVGVGLYQKNNQFLIHFWMKMKSFCDYLGLSNSCSSMMSSVERTDLDFKISVALVWIHLGDPRKIECHQLDKLPMTVFQLKPLFFGQYGVKILTLKRWCVFKSAQWRMSILYCFSQILGGGQDKPTWTACPPPLEPRVLNWNNLVWPK